MIILLFHAHSLLNTYKYTCVCKKYLQLLIKFIAYIKFSFQNNQNPQHAIQLLYLNLSLLQQLRF